MSAHAPNYDQFGARRHPCGCESYWDLAEWRSRITAACERHMDTARDYSFGDAIRPARVDR